MQSINARRRGDLLNGESCSTLKEAELVIEGSHQHHSRVRAHVSLDDYKLSAPEIVPWPASPAAENARLAMASRTSLISTTGGPLGEGCSVGNTAVTILLCTFNGARFLAEQLRSFSTQTYRNWRLVVSDDGSTDSTLQLLQDYKGKSPNEVTITIRPQRLGAIHHFMRVLTERETDTDYFACADQDDVWFPDKLERAMAWLASKPTELPAVYFSRTQYVDEAGNVIGLSPLFCKRPSFRNALVQSIGGGNTMVLNRAAHKLLRNAGPVRVASHDWWTYLLISAAGGAVLYDPVPSLAYRQHGNNQIGANQGFSARVKRLKMVGAGQFKTWLDWHTAALGGNRSLLTPENRELLDRFMAMRSGRLERRVAAWFAVRPYRQTFPSQMAFFATLLAGRV